MTDADRLDIIKRCLDNTAPESKYEDLGILYFAKTFLDNCNYRQAKIHYHMNLNILTMFDPMYHTVTDRQVWIKVFREAAKSTYFSFNLPLFLINLVGGTMYVRKNSEGYEGADVHNFDYFSHKIGPEFIEIFSETHTAAERFTMNIRTQLDINWKMKDVFGSKNPADVEDLDNDQTTKSRNNIYRRDTFTTPDGFIIVGCGAGQQARGANIFGRRPTLAIFDDIYSRRNVGSEDTREKIRYWFFAEAINSVDTVAGKIALLGTMMHEDTVFTDVARSSQWRGYTYPVIKREELDIALAACTINRDLRTLELPDNDTINTLEKSFTSIAWPSRQDLYYILSQYKQSFEMGKVNYFFQEKLNVLVSPDEEKFTDDLVHFTKVEVFYEDGMQWCEFEWQTYKWRGIYEPIIGIDLASSESSKSDDTAIIVAGYAHVYPQLVGYDVNTGADKHPYKRRGIRVPVITSSYIGKTDVYDSGRKRGIVNIVETFVQRYHVRRIACEIQGQQGLIAREIRRYLQEKKYKITVLEISAQGNKEERIQSILLPIMQSAKITIFDDNKNNYLIWSQLKHLGFSEHDDGADGYSIAMNNAPNVKGPDYQSKIMAPLLRHPDYSGGQSQLQASSHWEVV